MTKQIRTKPTNYFIKKDNELTKAEFYDMTVTAYRIILLAASDKFINTVRDNPLSTIYITPADYHDVFGTGSDNSPAYRALINSQKELLNAKLWRSVKKGNVDGIWKGGLNWLSKAYYNEEVSCLEIRFTPDIIPLILDVQKNYTYYNLRNIAKLNSMHSIRLYELMMFWRKKGATPALSIAYMRTWLGVKEGLHEEVKFFNRDVIKKSVDEITKKTDIALECAPQKEGRKTVGYTFSYTPKVTQINEHGEDESFGNVKQSGKFPPPNGIDGDELDLPF